MQIYVKLHKKNRIVFWKKLLVYHFSFGYNIEKMTAEMQSSIEL